MWQSAETMTTGSLLMSSPWMFVSQATRVRRRARGREGDGGGEPRLSLSDPPASASLGQVTSPIDEALRDDIRRLGPQLGDTLRRQEGPEFLALVEEVRAAAKALRAGEGPDDGLRDRLGRGRPDHRHPPGPGLLLLLPPGQPGRAGPPGGRTGAGRPPGLPYVAPPVRLGDATPEEVADAIGAPRRPAGVHRPPHRGVAALGHLQAPPGGRPAGSPGRRPGGRGRRGPDRPPDQRGDRPAVADRRAAAAPTHAGRRGRSGARRAST